MKLTTYEEFPDSDISLQNETKIKLKGGSLSGTYLIEKNGQKKIRKEISFSADREYGFVRWHSQLKKLQRLGSLFPDLFPKVIDFGIGDNHAYYDMEYLEGCVSGFEFLKNNPSDQKVDEFYNALISAMDRIHRVKRPSSKNGIGLYIYEEMERPLNFCSQNPEFKKFLEHRTIIFNGKIIPSIAHNIQKLYEIGNRYYPNHPQECYTHGNITLENLLWDEKNKKIWFIDVYEENIADNIYNEYSQLLQSSNSYYELFNSMDAHVNGNKVSLDAGKHPAIDYFNKKFFDFMKENLTEDELKIVKLYEISQFTRMLPFKLNVAKDKMIFFYSLASALFSDIISEIEGDIGGDN